MKSLSQRGAGILLPISSLPSPYGIGTLGKPAYNFIKWLKGAKMSIWQILPLLPTNYGDSPYQSCSATALNYYFIDFELLSEQGLLLKEEYADINWGDAPNRVDYEKLFLNKVNVLKKAYARFNKNNCEWKEFIYQGFYFDFAVFMTLKSKFNYLPWDKWGEYSKYDEQKINQFSKENKDEIDFWQFTQYIFLRQWNALKKVASKNGITIMGDIPIYVSYDSVEMWKYRKELFMLDQNSNPALVAGVPPDAFSEDGQLWGNPVYDWDKMQTTHYQWWRDRILYSLELVDVLRIDHFRGFDRFYAIPADSQTAKVGEWLKGPSASLFKGLEECPIVAEDLGIIDDSVRKMLVDTGYPGMKVLSFCFNGDPENEHKPSNYQKNVVAYSGTHDNAPLTALFSSMTEEQKASADEEIKQECLKLKVNNIVNTDKDRCLTSIRLLFESNANTVIVPMHDVLCLGEEARINSPATLSLKNWSFRYREDSFTGSDKQRLARLTTSTKRDLQ